MTDTLPRRWCPKCGRSVAVRTNGALREHRAHRSDPDLCEASGTVPPPEVVSRA